MESFLHISFQKIVKKGSRKTVLWFGMAVPMTSLAKEYDIDYAKELKESGPNLDLDLVSRVFGHQKWG